jgi:hypothetical protein
LSLTVREHFANHCVTIIMLFGNHKTDNQDPYFYGASFFKYLLGLIAVSFVAILLGLFSGGAGHGNYFLAKILFPYTMLSTHLNKVITAPYVILALFQFPVYDLLAGLASLKRKDIYVIAVILIIHSTAAYLCFYWPMPNFS